MATATEAPVEEPRTVSGAGAAVEIAGLRHRFGELEVLGGLGLEVAAGEVVGLVGPSGCGKSTLLELIAGLLEPSAGSLRVGGAEPAAERLARCVYMPQRDLLLPWLSALDNAALAPRNRGASRADARAEAAPLFEHFGLAGFERARPAELSGGMRQRVAFLRTLLADKPVLLLDEPFASLDAISRAEMQEWLAGALTAEPVTVVLVTPRRRGGAVPLRPRRGAQRPARADGRLAELAGAARDAAVRGGHLAGVHRRARTRPRGAGEGRAMKRWLLPLAVLVVLLGLWELAARWDLIADALNIKPFLIPAPSDVGEALWNDRELLAEDAWVTAQEVLLGFALALVLGFGFAIVLHLSDTLRRAFYPLLVASQTVPVIAIAPILIVWLGFGIGPKLAIIALVCFFPITVNTLDGLRSVDPDLPRMMRTLDAGRAQILRRVEIPSALPYVLSGAKIAAAISVIGAVFGEWAGADEGLGHLILIAQGQLQTARVFAAVVVLSALALILFGGLALIERRFGLVDAAPHRASRGMAAGGMKRILAAVAARALLLTTGCGEKQERRDGDAEPLTLMLDFYVNPDHAGIYTALDRGYFDEAGLEVEPQVPSDPSAPIRQVAAGRADLAISYEPEVLLAQNEGLPVIAVAALVPRPLTSLISLPEAQIAEPADLRGKTIATAGIPYQAEYLEAILDAGRPLDRRREPEGRRLQPAAGGALRAAPTRCSAGF